MGETHKADGRRGITTYIMILGPRVLHSSGLLGHRVPTDEGGAFVGPFAYRLPRLG